MNTAIARGKRQSGLRARLRIRRRAGGLLLACAALTASSAGASVAGCAAGPARGSSTSPLGARIADAALREYREFNGHRIGDDGHLLRFGSAESETELLYDPETGMPAADRPGRYAWRRVWEYWLALDRHAPGEALHRKLVFVPRLLGDPHSAERAQELELRSLLPAIGNGDTGFETALREAAVRAALNDSPWSAAFIGYVMDRASLSGNQFRYSPTHADYIRQAFFGDDNYAYRACDPRATTPSVGDLLCHARGTQLLKNFAAWQAAVVRPWFTAASHCEVVVRVDTDASKMDTVGGNVLQSVVLRTLRLNEDLHLSDNHDPDRYGEREESACRPENACARQNFNRQYWGVLLQLK
jgi:hypothetical protein